MRVEYSVCDQCGERIGNGGVHRLQYRFDGRDYNAIRLECNGREYVHERRYDLCERCAANILQRFTDRRVIRSECAERTARQ